MHQNPPPLYRRFLALNIVYEDRKICPTGPIDDFWHAHILDTHAYAQDCDYLFGRYLHHFPYFGMRGPDDYEALQTAFGLSAVLATVGVVFLFWVNRKKLPLPL